MRALLADADQITTSPLGHFRATPDRAREYRSNHTGHHKHEVELATLLLTTMLLQPPNAPFH